MSQAKGPDHLVGQPRGLSPLFFTEMWERFSFYGMRAIFQPFMAAAAVAGGLGYDASGAGAVLAVYMSMVYMMSLPGGWIADKYLGQRRAVFLGGVIIMIGHVLLALPSTTSFYLGLAALVIGTGFLKPNVSTMVGQLYAKDDPRIDGGFSIFYMGINVGAYASPIICGFLAQTDAFKAFLQSHGISPHASWHFGFGAAAVGMALGLVIFRVGTRNLPHLGAPPSITDPAERAKNLRTLTAIIAAVVLGPLSLWLVHTTGVWPMTKERIANVFGVVLLVLFLGTFWLLYQKAQGRERKGVAAMFVLAIGCVAFFSLFEQAAGTMNAFATDRTHNVAFGKSFPAAWYQSINSVFIILLSPIFAWMFTRVAERKLPFNDVRKFGVSLVFMALAFVFMLPAARATDLVSPLYLVLFYFMSTVAELFLSPVGLSSMSKLAPASAGGLVMGVWFMSTANGEYIAGRVHGLTGDFPLDTLFLVVAIGALIVAGLMFAAGWYYTHKVPLESLMRGASDADEPEQAPAAVPQAQVVTAGNAPALAATTVSGDAIAAFATAAATWPPMIEDPKLGGIIVLVLGTASLTLAMRGLRECRRHGVGGKGFALAAPPLVLGAGLYALLKVFVLTPDTVPVATEAPAASAEHGAAPEALAAPSAPAEAPAPATSPSGQ